MFYEIAVTHTLNRLKALTSFLKVIEVQAHKKGMTDADVMALQIAPDMFPLLKQIQVATDNAKGAIARLTGNEIPVFEDDEKSFDDLYTRIEKTMLYAKSMSHDDFIGAQDRKIEISYFPNMHFTATGYVLGFHIPNFHFHTVTAYNICRHHGFEIGKKDFAGELPLIPNN